MVQRTSNISVAVIPTAGLATRFFPVAKTIPKGLIPIIDKPMIQFVVEEAAQAGIKKILFVTSGKDDLIENYFRKDLNLETELLARGKNQCADQIKTLSSLCEIDTVVQKEPLGLGHAVLVAKEKIGNQPFALMLSDEILISNPPPLANLIDAYEKYSRSCVGVMTVADSEVHKYGIVVGEPDSKNVWKVKSVVEKPQASDTPSRLSLPGRYVFTPQIFDELKNVKPGRNGEIQLTDAIESLAKSQGVMAVELFAKRYDTGNKLGYLEAMFDMVLEHPEVKDTAVRLMKAALAKWEK